MVRIGKKEGGMMRKALSAVTILVMALALCGATTQPKTSYVASSKGSVYHLPSCSATKRIAVKNFITYDTKEDAEKAGKTACKICHP